jgi:hypothetical protein
MFDRAEKNNKSVKTELFLYTTKITHSFKLNAKGKKYTSFLTV